jgi:hypothetical protein
MGEIWVVLDGDEIWAETEIRADRVLLAAMGADISNCGYGDRGEQPQNGMSSSNSSA